VTSVLFACEYYPPFAPGGAEWTTEAWAGALARRGHAITVVTPNYGAPARERRDGVSIIRIPFPVRLSPGQGEVRGIFHRNPLFYLYFGWQIHRAARAAGARFLHAGPLRLYPAIRDRFLPLLDEHFPELAARYRAAYATRSSAPRAYARALNRRIRRLQARFGFAVNNGMADRYRPGRPPVQESLPL